MRTRKYLLSEKIEQYAAYHAYTISAQKSDKLRRMDELLKKAIKYELTERQKKCIMYYYYESKNVEEIAKILSIRPTTVYKHLSKARTALKKCALYL